MSLRSQHLYARLKETLPQTETVPDEFLISALQENNLQMLLYQKPLHLYNQLLHFLQKTDFLKMKHDLHDTAFYIL